MISNILSHFMLACTSQFHIFSLDMLGFCRLLREPYNFTFDLI